MGGAAEPRLQVGPIGDEHRRERWVVVFGGDVQRCLAIGVAGERQGRPLGDKSCHLLRLAGDHRGEEFWQLWIIGRHHLRGGPAADIGRDDRVQLRPLLLDVGMELPPTGKAELAGHL